MEPYLEILSECPLFQGIPREELAEMVTGLGGRVLDIPKGDPVFLEGDPAGAVGVVLAGAVHIVRDDYYGNRSVLTVVQPGDLFAEAFACAGLAALPVSAVALRPSTVLLLDCQRLLATAHSPLVGNLLRVTARKNLMLTQKIRYMSQKTTREKLTAYLLDRAKERGSDSFTIPYDRQALADYLGVERSAMSAELSKMKQSGLLDTRGSWFCLRPGKHE